MFKFVWNRVAFDQHKAILDAQYASNEITFYDYLDECERLMAFAGRLSIDIA